MFSRAHSEEAAVHPRFMSWIVFAICAALTLVVFMDARDWDQRRLKLRLELDAEVWRDALAQEIRNNLMAVEDLHAFLETVDGVDRRVFGRFAALVRKNHAAIRALEWIPRVPESRRNECETAARREGFAGFEFTERSNTQVLVPAGRRDEYLPVYFVEPYAANEKALGYDLASEGIRKTMLDEARDRGATCATQPITLVQQEAGRRGILIAQPLYRGGEASDSVAARRENLRGYALGVLDVDSVVESLIARQSKGSFRLQVYDKNAPTVNRFLYSYPPSGVPAATASLPGARGNANATLASATEVKVADRTWMLVYTPTSGDRKDFLSYVPWFALCGGLVFSTLIAVYVFNLGNQAEEVGRLVKRRTRELDESNRLLRVSEEKFATAFRDNPSPMAIISQPEQRFLDANDAFLCATGYRREEVLGAAPAALGLFAQAEQQETLARCLRQEGHIKDYEVTLRRKDGGLGYNLFSANTITLRDERVLLTVMHDITARKQAEQRERFRRRVLEMLAADAPLKTILEVIVRFIENESPASIASVLLLDRDGRRLRHGAAPGLPDFYNEAVDGLVIGDGAGSCGTAAATQRTVIVEDVQTHPYWADFRDLARRAGIRACWSQPMFSMTGRLLGTFAIYHRTSHVPNSADQESILYAAGITGRVVEHYRVEEDIRQSEERFRLLVERAPIPMAFVSDTGTASYINHQFTRVLGYTQEDIPTLDKWWPLACPNPEMQQRIMARWEAATASANRHGRQIRPEEYEVACKNGSVRMMEISGVRIYDGLLVTFVDLTARRQMEAAVRESEEKFRLTTTTARDAIVMLDNDGKVTFWNRAAEEMFGYSDSEALGRELHPWLAPERYHAAFRKGFPVFQATGQGAAAGRTLELAAIRKDGVEVPVELSLSTTRLAGQWHALAIVRDITERRRVMKELHQAKEAADDANSAKSQFLARMSHEIRTPLNAVLGFTQLLLRDTGLAASHRSRLEAISSNGEHLLTLITGVLDMSKIETGRLTLQDSTFDLPGLLKDVENMFRARALARQLQFGMEVTGEIPPHACGDRGKIQQVFVNLIGNAIKFTSRGGVMVRVREMEKKANSAKIRVEVEDSGRGIPPEAINQLFQPFAQAGKSVQSATGSGLGLYISRQFARLMGGDITVKSQVGVGSVFQFDFALEFSSALSTAKETETRLVKRLRPGQPPCRVLIVDDVKDNRVLLDQMLSPAGFVCFQATNGLETLAGLKEWKPQLILMDVHMPGMDGNETTRRIRAGAEHRDVKIVAITASAFEDDRQAATAAGADSFLAKPIRQANLFAQIKTALGVEYLYEDEPATAASSSNSRAPGLLTREFMSSLPVVLLKQMHEAVVIADFDRVIELIQQVETHSSSTAQSLRQLAEQFDSEKLLALTETETT